MSQEGLIKGAAALRNLAVCGLWWIGSSFREHSGSIVIAVPPEAAALEASDSWRSGGYICSARAEQGVSRLLSSARGPAICILAAEVPGQPALGMVGSQLGIILSWAASPAQGEALEGGGQELQVRECGCVSVQAV